MASRQGGPGNDDGPGTGTTERRTAPHAASPETDRGASTARPGSPEPSAAVSENPSRTPPSRGRTPEDPPLRDPGLYALTDHFRERLQQPGRYVSTRTVSDAIRAGQLRWNQTDGWRFAVVRDGIRFVVVVADTDTNSPVVVTAWTEVADRESALKGGRFDPVDVDTIAVRTALSESSSTPVPDRIRPRSITRPFVVGGHRLETEPGDPHVRCVDCGCRFRSKSAITARSCRGGRRGR